MERVGAGWVHVQSRKRGGCMGRAMWTHGQAPCAWNGRAWHVPGTWVSVGPTRVQRGACRADPEGMYGADWARAHGVGGASTHEHEDVSCARVAETNTRTRRRVVCTGCREAARHRMHKTRGRTNVMPVLLSTGECSWRADIPSGGECTALDIRQRMCSRLMLDYI